MVALESSAEVPGDGGGQKETQRAEPAVSRAGTRPPTGNAGGGTSAGGEGNHSKLFSIAVATGPAVTTGLPPSAGRPPGDSVRARAGAPWSGSGSVNGVGGASFSRSGGGEQSRREISRTY